MSKLFLSLISIFILIIVALLVIPSFIDWSDYKVQIKDQVAKATGYQVDINGPLKAAILPYPHVTLNNVAVDSADAKGPVAFQGQVENASVSVALIPLLSGTIVVNDVTLVKPVLNVQEQTVTPSETTISNNGNNEGEDTTSSSAPMVQIDNVSVTDAEITYKSLAGDAMAITIPNLKMSADDLMGPYAFDGRIIYNDFDLTIDGETKAAFDKTQALPVRLNINDKAYNIVYSGIVDMSGEAPSALGEFSLTAGSIQKLAAQFGASDIKVKDQSINLQGMVNGSVKSIQLENGTLALGNSNEKMPLTFQFSPENKKGLIKLQNIPGGGMIDLDMAMMAAQTVLAGQLKINDVKALAVDVLGVIEKSVFDNPQIPNSVSGDIDVALGDSGIVLSSNAMDLGDYNLKQTKLNYKTGDVPVIDASIGNFEGAKLSASGTLDASKGVKVSVSHPNAAKFIQVFQPDFEASPVTSQSFSFNGTVLQDGDKIAVQNMTSKIGTIDIDGGLSIDQSASVPSIVATIQFGNLDTQALLTGEKSKGTSNQSGGSGSTTSQKSSGASPWTRDAIDTSFLRALNLELDAKAKQLTHGTWIISNPEIDINIQNGVMTINAIKGGLFEGNVDISGRAEAKTEGQPLSVSSSIKATNVNLNKFVKAAMSQNKDRVVGTGGFNIDLSTNGLSSSALIYALKGDGKITTSNLIVKGIDLAKVTEAISDESLTDLVAVVQSAFKTGQTAFQPIDHEFTIREGTVAIDNFTLVSDTANLISNGEVSFSRWDMNVKNTVDFTKPDDLPNVEMTLKGPLNAPQQNVANDVLVSFIKNKYGAKIQNKVNKLIGDKLGDNNPAGALINNLLGLPQQKKEVEPTPTSDAANDNAAPAQQPQAEQPQPKLEEQLIRGLFDKLGG
jgi:uncharacterized protein involved in outer membrane biogenesis